MSGSCWICFFHFFLINLFLFVHRKTLKNNNVPMFFTFTHNIPLELVFLVIQDSISEVYEVGKEELKYGTEPQRAT